MDVLQDCDFPLKGTASEGSRVHEGGRLEDLRELILYARKVGLKVRTYNLFTGFIGEAYTIDHLVTEEYINKQHIAFWISFQVVLNLLGTKEPETYGSLVFELDKLKKIKLMQCRVLHIREPGKNRDLIMSTSVLTWFLTPAGKTLLRVISKHPNHRDGCIGSSQGWKAMMMISKFERDHWIHAFQKDMKPFFFFSDWKEATDFCGKHEGLAVLRALMDFSSFPSFYGTLVREVISLPQPALEEIKISYLDSDDVYTSEKTKINLMVRNGYMMGNPVTKVVLHAFHLAEESIVRQLLLALDYTEEVDRDKTDVCHLKIPKEVGLREPYSQG